MLVVKAKVRNCSPRGILRTGLEKEHIWGESPRRKVWGYLGYSLRSSWAGPQGQEGQ